ncbi:transposon TX1, partial [Tanacetum coccineum]
MYYVREKTRASNHLVRESDVRHKRHIGNRWEYNGKRLGTNYTGGKRNSTVSFMFFNFPTDWGMGNLWMLFKKFGTVFDMYMVQKRLRNGERYGFVRFKLVTNVEELLKRLREIKFGEENLKVFVAYDRKNLGVRGDEVKRNVGNEMRKESGWKNNGWNGGTRDERNFAEVVNGEKRERDKKDCGWEGRNDGYRNQGEKIKNKEQKEDVRTVEANMDQHYWSTGTSTLHFLTGQLYEKKFKVDVIEEVGDVMELEMEEKGAMDKNKIEHKETHEKGDDNDMVISNSESRAESSDDGIDSEDERDEADDVVGNGIRPQVDGGQKMEEDEESRFSGMSRVCETHEEEITKKEEKSAVDVDKSPREDACWDKKNKAVEKRSAENLGSTREDVSYDNLKGVESQHDGVENNYQSGQQFDNGPGNGPSIEMGLFNGKNELNHCGPSDEITNELDDSIIEKTSLRGEKRGVHPTSSSSSGDDRINKKRKANGDDEDDVVSNTNGDMSNSKDVEFDEANKTNVINEGVHNGTQNGSKKGGKKGIKKVAREQRVGGLGTNGKGVSDVDKVYNDEGDGKKETFVFRSTGRADSDSKGCSINMEHVKEIGVIIGVSWAKAEDEKARGVESVVREDE